NSFRILGRLGNGSFGEVTRVASSGGHEYALKSLKPSTKRTSYNNFDHFRVEAQIHESVAGHPHILPYYGNFEADGKFHVLSDVCEGGNLDSFIRKRKLLGRDNEVKRIFLQILSAVRHCHAKGVAHRDIKPENVLAANAEGAKFYLSDFGLSVRERWSCHFGSGTRPYMSPECLGFDLLAEEYDAFASDVWSLGIILLEMVTGDRPWNVAHPVTDPRYSHYLRNRESLRAYHHIHDEFMPVLIRMLHPDPLDRITLDELEESIKSINHF
ncbi:kinase-like domain-containing protein, partial [Vararia minispora EC-137]